MPCDTIRTTEVQLERCNATLMLAALTSLCLNPLLQADGYCIYFGNNERINCQTGAAALSRWRDQSEIKRAYAAEVVKATAKKYGWQGAAKNTNQQFTYNRR